MILKGRIIKIKKQKNIMFIIIKNYKFQQIVVKEINIDKYSKRLSIGDIISCDVVKDLNNNGKYKCQIESFVLSDLIIISKNKDNYKLNINVESILNYNEVKFNIRKFLHQLGYVEMDLPILTNGETSSKAESFQTIYSKNCKKLFLRKTMDIFLRMYSCSDINKIFSIGKCFRNELLTAKNKPEFEMLSIFTNYLEKNEAINLSIDILKIITSNSISIKYCDFEEYKTIEKINDLFYVITGFQDLNNSYCSVVDNDKTDEFKIKYKGITVVHGTGEISNYEEYLKKIEIQGKKNNYGELETLEKLINSGAPECYNLGISIIRILSLFNNCKIKDYDILSFDRLK